MFNFLKDIKDIEEDIKELKYQVFPAKPWVERYGGTVLESRLSNLEYKFDALLAHLKLATDYTEEAKSEVIIRKRTKQDDEDEETMCANNWF